MNAVIFFLDTEEELSLRNVTHLEEARTHGLGASQAMWEWAVQYLKQDYKVWVVNRLCYNGVVRDLIDAHAVAIPDLGCVVLNPINTPLEHRAQQMELVDELHAKNPVLDVCLYIGK
jgi:hypothetical protein